MLKEIIETTTQISLIRDGKTIDGTTFKKDFLNMLEGAYFSPSYIIADQTTVNEQVKKGVWLEFAFDKSQKYHDYDFDKLLVIIKPKYNFLTFYRNIDGEYKGKCINLNLSNKTTNLYNSLISFEGADNEK